MGNCPQCGTEFGCDCDDELTPDKSSKFYEDFKAIEAMRTETPMTKEQQEEAWKNAICKLTPEALERNRRRQSQE